METPSDLGKKETAENLNFVYLRRTNENINFVYLRRTSKNINFCFAGFWVWIIILR